VERRSAFAAIATAVNVTAANRAEWKRGSNSYVRLGAATSGPNQAEERTGCDSAGID